MTINSKTKERARTMRASGSSLSEIVDTLKIAKSTASLWVRDVHLSSSARESIRAKHAEGRQKSARVLRARTAQRELDASRYAQRVLRALRGISMPVATALLGVYYWCEGNKSPKDLVVFTNSDPAVIQAFLSLFRYVFELDERRFRVCVHLHEYHDASIEIPYWSELSGIPQSQFIKPYLKPHTRIRVRPGYRGCVQIRYHDIRVARALLALGKLLNKEVATGQLYV